MVLILSESSPPSTLLASRAETWKLCNISQHQYEYEGSQCSSAQLVGLDCSCTSWGLSLGSSWASVGPHSMLGPLRGRRKINLQISKIDEHYIV